MSDPRLATLCRLFDLEPFYEDIWGNRHEVKPPTAQALIAAMGVDLSRADAERVIAERQAAPWRRRLAPVQVVPVGERTQVVLRLRQGEADKTLRYAIALEQGERRTAEVRPAELKVLERAHVDGADYAAYALPLADLPLGYHRLELESVEGGTALALIVTPRACYVPEAIAGDGRVWGAALQLYALR